MPWTSIIPTRRRDPNKVTEHNKGTWAASTCRLTDDEKECCCNCKHLAMALSHPMTDGKSLSHNRGYVCLAPEVFDPKTMRKEVITDVGEHGMCEMWEHWSK
jgi:hypothetical protein